MTVSELIQKLTDLPGDPDLRMVIVQMSVGTPYLGKPKVITGNSIDDVSISHDVVNLNCHGYSE